MKPVWSYDNSPHFFKSAHSNWRDTVCRPCLMVSQSLTPPHRNAHHSHTLLWCSPSSTFIFSNSNLCMSKDECERQPLGSAHTVSGNTNHMEIHLIMHCLFLFPCSHSLIRKSTSSFSWLRTRHTVRSGSGRTGPQRNRTLPDCSTLQLVF